MTVLETARLRLRHLGDADADFILELLNEPDFLRFIGDRGVRSTEDAREYIRTGPGASYQTHGFGLYLVEARESAERVGICGLLKRDALEDVDVGYAILQRHWRRGYALESAAAVLEHARDALGIERVVAVTVPGNAGSVRVLERLGMRYERMVRLPGQEQESALYVPAP